uniref:CUE domain-containing protein n=1 Tax=Steinernema glaseri TaxID=37863 RepID=A0A1I8AKD0_9BILA
MALGNNNVGETDITRLRVEDLCTVDRYPKSFFQSYLLMLYTPLGFIIALFRFFLGIHLFILACLLRKTNRLRSVVLRSTMVILGIHVVNSGPAKHWDRKTRMIVSNHVTPLDHLAIDLVEPCLLPSSWEIPGFLRWVLGYTDMGAENGRECLVQTIRSKCRDITQPPILAFPEGAVTSGKCGLLKFSTWPFEAADSVQPVILKINRLFFSDLAPSTLGSIWWHDILFFILAPMTIVTIHWLPPVHRRLAKDGAGDHVDETVEEYTNRVVKAMAEYSGFAATNLTCEDVVDAAYQRQAQLDREREERELAASNKFQRKNGKVSGMQLDEWAMRVKQSFPQIRIHAIREDLSRTLSIQTTEERIKAGRLDTISKNVDIRLSQPTSSAPLKNAPADFRALYDERKWTMLEKNREKYLDRLSQATNFDDDDDDSIFDEEAQL